MHRLETDLEPRSSSMVVICGRRGDVALVAGISRPKRRYEPLFGRFFVLWGCRLDVLTWSTRQSGVVDVVYLIK